MKDEFGEADHMVVHDHDHYLVKHFQLASLVVLVRLDTRVKEDVDGCTK